MCGVNTKDALSDTQPEISPVALKEELPNFMITYRPETEGGKQNGELDVNKAESSNQNTLLEATIEENKVSIPFSVNLEEQSVKENVDCLVHSVESTANINTPMAEQFTSPVSRTSNEAALEQSRSPMWLDALIVGLISLLIGLVVQKFAY